MRQVHFHFLDFVTGSARIVTRGRPGYWIWLAALAAVIAIGLLAYANQLQHGLITANMREYVVKQLRETVIPGLERVSGIMMYDMSDPRHPSFVQYINNRDFQGDPESPEVEPGAFFRIKGDATNGGVFGFPEWMPVTITEIGLNFKGVPDGEGGSGDLDIGLSDSAGFAQARPLLDPSNFKLIISGGMPLLKTM